MDMSTPVSYWCKIKDIKAHMDTSLTSGPQNGMTSIEAWSSPYLVSVFRFLSQSRYVVDFHVLQIDLDGRKMTVSQNWANKKTNNKSNIWVTQFH
jgi:hypothetical protein